ncbi:hypothetical protein [Rhizobium laguerreae]|uniref:hypothetical protein n=1 Tax=Rhizobium laguerreae TaxID=1076926 RepID=UPI0028A5A1DF|nr:hypothetical protein [Rhizobium laguerreae]
MEGRLHALAAFGNRLVGQPDDLHADLAGRDHDLNLDRHAFDSLKCHRTDTRDHMPIPLPQTLIPPPAVQGQRLQSGMEAGIKQEQSKNVVRHPL